MKDNVLNDHDRASLSVAITTGLNLMSTDTKKTASYAVITILKIFTFFKLMHRQHSHWGQREKNE